jgi:hypothetical protein
MQFFKAHRSFAKNGLKQRKHFNPELHLLVLLKLLGSEGGAASAIVIKHGLCLGKGSVLHYIRRATDAVLSVFSDTVFWPNADEWVEISRWIHDKFHFPKCVGMIDGSFFGLAYKSEVHGEEYFNCKQQYVINSMIFFDDLLST